MKVFMLGMLVSGLLLAEDVKPPVIPQELQSAFVTATVASNKAQVILEIAQAKLDLMKTQELQSVAAKKINDVCGDVYIATQQSTGVIECIIKDKK